MRLHAEEPQASSWEALDDVELTARARALFPAEKSALVLVDGRSGGGKSTFAERLSQLLGGMLVHSDDIVWHLDPINWADFLVDGVIGSWRRGRFRPPGWVALGRPGAVELPPNPVLIVEGVGAGRSGLAAGAELVVWVQSDRAEARSAGSCATWGSVGRPRMRRRSGTNGCGRRSRSWSTTRHGLEHHSS